MTELEHRVLLVALTALMVVALVATALMLKEMFLP